MPKTNLLQKSDSAGCHFYRMGFPSMRAATISKEVLNIETPLYIFNEPIYNLLSMAMFRPSNLSEQIKVLKGFFAPLREKYGFWMIYNTDDVIVHKDIPPYNIGRKAYEGQERYDGLKEILNLCDLTILTTDILKEYYVNEFQISPDKFLVIPNYLPRWWVGEAFDVSNRMEIFNKNHKKPRIGIISSTSHFDIENLNNGVDDFTHINDFIRSTVDKYQWVFIGTIPRQLTDLAQQRKIEVHPGSDILNYLRELHDKQLNLIVAPIQDNHFNRSKSNIKLIESWSLGIPVIAQDLPLYSKYTDSVFKNADELQNQIDRHLRSKEKYKDYIKEHRNIVDNGDSNAPNGWWLEKNMDTWFKIFTLPKRGINVTINEDKLKGIELPTLEVK